MHILQELQDVVFHWAEISLEWLEFGAACEHPKRHRTFDVPNYKRHSVGI